jgi:hypothetical protein
VSSSEVFSTVASKDVKFKDFDQLHEHARDQLGFDNQDDDLPMVAFRDGKFLLRGHEDVEPSEFAETYECWGLSGCGLIADHMIEGRMLVRLDPEGWEERLVLITPGKAEEVDVVKLLGF